MRLIYIFLVMFLLIGAAHADYLTTSANFTIGASTPAILRVGTATYEQVITLADPSLNGTMREAFNRYEAAKNLCLKPASGDKILLNGTRYDYVNTTTKFAVIQMIPFNGTDTLAVALRGTWTGA